jgi:hypothetical protein
LWNNSAGGASTSSTCRGVFRRQKCAMVQRHLCGCGEQPKALQQQCRESFGFAVAI